MTQDYLVQLLRAYWFAPPVALWRAVELRAAAKLSYGRPLLDLGCGDGLIGQVLFAPQGQVDVGLDPWVSQLRQAAKSGVYHHIDRGLGDALPYVADHFSTVFSNSVLEHIPDVKPVVRQVARVLSPNGHFIFTVPSDAFRQNLDGYVRCLQAEDPERAEAYARTVDERLEHCHYHTVDEWEALLSDTGMALVRAEYYMPREAERFWDRMNNRYGVGRRRSAWRILVSPRLQPLGYQGLLRRIVVKHLSQRWRPYYQMNVRPGTKGGGLLIVAQGKE
ncbi:MAG: class I SAM-dependent methyltransferase [Chloroflexota bacterium]|nr:class I SAM-dependent methyltransferase [Chloroflexota bacterium]